MSLCLIAGSHLTKQQQMQWEDRENEQKIETWEVKKTNLNPCLPGQHRWQIHRKQI